MSGSARLAAFFGSQVGRKFLMAVTGAVMVVFLCIHALGNLTIYSGFLNVYAARLQSLGPFLWIVRLAMAVVLGLHIVLGVSLTCETRQGRPQGYAVSKKLSAGLSSTTMIWTGAAIGIYLMFHLLHFTFQAITPASGSRHNLDLMGRPDVLLMLVAAFRRTWIFLLYAAGLCAVGLHLFHGLHSSFQSMGLGSDAATPLIGRAGKIAVFVLLLAYLSIPFAVAMGIVRT